MSDEEEEDQREEEAMPPHKIRFTDMSDNLVEKTIRRKYKFTTYFLT